MQRQATALLNILNHVSAEITDDHCDVGQDERPEGDLAVGGGDSGGQSGHC